MAGTERAGEELGLSQRGKGMVKQQAVYSGAPGKGVSLEQPVNPDKPSLDISPETQGVCFGRQWWR